MPPDLPLAETDELAAELYLVPPARFVATRDEVARRARQAGARQLADELRRLRRPATSAWLVNLLARHERPALDELLALGRGLRRAQLELDEAELRRLARLRRELVADLLRRARRHAAEAGQRLSPTVEAEVEGTLHAATVDLAAGATVLSGRLSKPLSHTGFGPRPDLDAGRQSPTAPAPPPPLEPFGIAPPVPTTATTAAPTTDYDGHWQVTAVLRAVPTPEPDAPLSPEHDADPVLRRAQQRLAQAQSLHWLREQELLSEEAADADARERVDSLDRQRILARRDRVAAARRLAQAREAQREAALALDAARRALHEAQSSLPLHP